MPSHEACVYEWLANATCGLWIEAKKRIVVEVCAHFNEAKMQYQSQGLSEAEAISRAVDDLGDPKKARHSFKRIYLTQRQAKSVSKLVARHEQKKKLLDWFSILFVCIAMPLVLIVGMPAFLSLLLLYPIAKLLAYLRTQKPSKVIVFDALLGLALGLVCPAVFFLAFMDRNWVQVLVGSASVAALTVLMSLRLLHIARKLRLTESQAAANKPSPGGP